MLSSTVAPEGSGTWLGLNTGDGGEMVLEVFSPGKDETRVTLWRDSSEGGCRMRYSQEEGSSSGQAGRQFALEQRSS